eukprot:gnl/Chilomastix_cuspidata/1345.p1 GENE.gnl/Chilomastix_cuspidata/1345~~gnl/Chilomastix_cuspidata/1345.p1  ORF type:complete len:820 (+),score=178.45 gnl/Chilomastix_cuspidata/1345:27-2486(+)
MAVALLALLLLLVGTRAAHTINTIGHTVDNIRSDSGYWRRGMETNITLDLSVTDSPSNIENLYLVYVKVGEDGPYLPATQKSKDDNTVFGISLFIFDQTTTLYIKAEANQARCLRYRYDIPAAIEDSFEVTTQLPLTLEEAKSNPFVTIIVSGEVVLVQEDLTTPNIIVYFGYDLGTSQTLCANCELVRAALDGDRILLTLDGESETVHAYEYNPDTSLYEAVSFPLPADHIVNDGFGSCVALSGDTAVVGAESRANGLYLSAGGVYVYRIVDGVWTETQLIVQNFPQINEKLGMECDIAGNVLVVSGDRDKTYIYEAPPGTRPFQLSKTIMHYGDTTAATANPVRIATDGTNVLLVPYYSTSFEIAEIYSKNENGGWDLDQLVPMGTEIKEVSLRRGICVLMSSNLIQAHSRNSNTREWELVQSVSDATSFIDVSTDGFRVCLTQDSTFLICYNSDDSAPAYATLKLNSFSGSSQEITFTLKLFKASGVSVTADVNIFSESISVSTAGSSVTIDFANYPCDMGADPIAVELDTYTQPVNVNPQTLKVYRHEYSTSYDEFTVEDITRMQWDETAGDYTEQPYSQAVGESLAVNVTYLSYTNVGPWCYNNIGSEPSEPTRIAGSPGRHEVTLAPAKYPSVDFAKTAVCLTNWYNGDTQFCIQPSVGGYTKYHRLYPYVFPFAPVTAEGVAEVTIGFVNHYYMPVTEGIAALTVNGAPAVATATDGLYTYSLGAEAGNTKTKLELYIEVDNHHPSVPLMETNTTEVYLSVSRHQVIHSIPAKEEVVGYVQLYDQDGNEVTDERPVEVFWNGVHLGRAEYTQ